jgi:hypothetical protein
MPVIFSIVWYWIKLAIRMPVPSLDVGWSDSSHRRFDSAPLRWSPLAIKCTTSIWRPNKRNCCFNSIVYLSASQVARMTYMPLTLQYLLTLLAESPLLDSPVRWKFHSYSGMRTVVGDSISNEGSHNSKARHHRSQTYTHSMHACSTVATCTCTQWDSYDSHMTSAHLAPIWWESGKLCVDVVASL